MLGWMTTNTLKGAPDNFAESNVDLAAWGIVCARHGLGLSSSFFDIAEMIERRIIFRPRSVHLATGEVS